MIEASKTMLCPIAEIHLHSCACSSMDVCHQDSTISKSKFCTEFRSLANLLSMFLKIRMKIGKLKIKVISFTSKFLSYIQRDNQLKMKGCVDQTQLSKFENLKEGYMWQKFIYHNNLPHQFNLIIKYFLIKYIQ